MAEEKVENKIPADIQKMSFEEALAELENIVGDLEQGSNKLDAAIDAYSRGTALKKHCEAKLRDAKERIEKISVNGDGSVASEPANIE
jgi:exodeoxyribonuclease VII small subunit